jgi:hypothetical protein
MNKIKSSALTFLLYLESFASYSVTSLVPAKVGRIVLQVAVIFSGSHIHMCNKMWQFAVNSVLFMLRTDRYFPILQPIKKSTFVTLIVGVRQ